MTMITIKVPDDLAPNQDKEREYDVSFSLERTSWTRRTRIDIRAITDDKGQNVTGTEFDFVASHAQDCYYDEMLAAVRGR